MLSVVVLVYSIGSVAITVGCLSRTTKPSGFLSRVTSVVVNSLIFVDSDYQGKGYGRKIIETLEKDEYFLRAKRVENGYSMNTLSEKIGRTAKSYENKEKGITEFTRNEIFQLIGILKLSVKEVFEIFFAS